MYSLPLFLSFIATIFPGFSESSGLSKGLFDDADLTFIFITDQFPLVDVDSDFPYFNFLKLKNSYTPLRQLVMKAEYLSLYENNVASFKYRATEKSARSKVVFLPAAPSRYLEFDDKLECESLLMLADTTLRQDYVFLETRYTECFTDLPESMGSAKFVTFEKGVIHPS